MPSSARTLTGTLIRSGITIWGVGDRLLELVPQVLDAHVVNAHGGWFRDLDRYTGPLGRGPFGGGPPSPMSEWRQSYIHAPKDTFNLCVQAARGAC